MINRESSTTDANDDCSKDDFKDEIRQISIQPKPGGDPGGVAVWLRADDLADMGVDPDDTNAVAVTIDDGDLRVRPAEAPDGV